MLTLEDKPYSIGLKVIQSWRLKVGDTLNKLDKKCEFFVLEDIESCYKEVPPDFRSVALQFLWK